MGRKAKYTKQQKVQACEDYLNGVKSASQIAKELNMSKNGYNMILSWAHSYKVNGHTIFDNKKTNNRYSKEFKNHVVQEYLQGLGSSSYLAAKYGIPKHSTVLEWVKKYNGCEELKDYLPNPEVYMADTLKVSKEKNLKSSDTASIMVMIIKALPSCMAGIMHRSIAGSRNMKQMVKMV